MQAVGRLVLVRGCVPATTTAAAAESAQTDSGVMPNTTTSLHIIPIGTVPPMPRVRADDLLHVVSEVNRLDWVDYGSSGMHMSVNRGRMVLQARDLAARASESLRRRRLASSAALLPPRWPCCGL